MIEIANGVFISSWLKAEARDTTHEQTPHSMETAMHKLEEKRQENINALEKTFNTLRKEEENLEPGTAKDANLKAQRESTANFSALDASKGVGHYMHITLDHNCITLSGLFLTRQHLLNWWARVGSNNLSITCQRDWRD